MDGREHDGGDPIVNISSSRVIRVLALVPFGYFALTRLKAPRDYAYLIASSWLPGFWLIYRLTELDLTATAVAFSAGYFAFIAAYEVGYLINDAWDTARSKDSRKRIDFAMGWPFVALFLLIRIGAWVAVGIKSGWIDHPIWLAGYGALAIAFTQHNLSQSKALRLASFYELATLRFLLPIAAVIPRSAISIVILIALLLYVYPRFLAYMDSKAVLSLDERKRPGFGFQQLAFLTPVILYLAYLSGTNVLAELLAYFLVVHGLWWAAASHNETLERQFKS